MLWVLILMGVRRQYHKLGRTWQNLFPKITGIFAESIQFRNTEEQSMVHIFQVKIQQKDSTTKMSDNQMISNPKYIPIHLGFNSQYPFISFIITLLDIISTNAHIQAHPLLSYHNPPSISNKK